MAQYETANPDQDTDHATVSRPSTANDSAMRNGNAHLNGRTNGHSIDSAGRSSKEEYGTGFERPAAVQRLGSNRPRTDSPAMATTDEAFHGLSHGMHGDERPANARSNSRIV